MLAFPIIHIEYIFAKVHASCLINIFFFYSCYVSSKLEQIYMSFLCHANVVLSMYTIFPPQHASFTHLCSHFTYTSVFENAFLG